VRILDREARHPPPVPVPLRFDGSSLPVPDVAERDRVDRLYDAYAHDRLVAEVARTLEDVDVGAVVMRLVEENPVLQRGAHPFTAPCVSP
jgi:hypothetical protein